jgi:hypothetical protein
MCLWLRKESELDGVAYCWKPVTEIVTVTSQKGEIPANAGQVRFDDLSGILRNARLEISPCLDCKTSTPGSNPGGASNFP